MYRAPTLSGRTMNVNQRRFFRHLLIALTLWLLAGAQRFWIAPQLTRLPADYAEETSYAARCRYRDAPTAAWQQFSLIARRVDQTLVTFAGNSVIQGDMHWTTPAGEVTYESAGLYGVDRFRRANLAGYGNVSRAGQFLFPMHLQPATYRFWDPFYTGPRTATFERTATLNGLKVYVFSSVADHVDDTKGYLFLPDVPERYRAYSAGQGKLWIEPVSGVVVDFEDAGVSYFGKPRGEAGAKPQRVADFYFWDARYTPETQAAQRQRATAARRRILALERWLPLGLLFSGLFVLAHSWRRARQEVSP